MTNTTLRRLLCLAACATALALGVGLYRSVWSILTPAELETILGTRPASQEDLWQAIAMVSDERRVELTADALERIDRDAKIYLDLRLRDDLSLIERISWYGDGFAMTDARHFDIIGARRVWDWYLSAAPPDSYVILLDSDRKILGWVPPR